MFTRIFACFPSVIRIEKIFLVFFSIFTSFRLPSHDDRNFPTFQLRVKIKYGRLFFFYHKNERKMMNQKWQNAIGIECDFFRKKLESTTSKLT